MEEHVIAIENSFRGFTSQYSSFQQQLVKQIL